MVLYLIVNPINLEGRKTCNKLKNKHKFFKHFLHSKKLLRTFGITFYIGPC